ncbi:mitochondrial substrate carrier family protein [Striga asiatica]|uniref:Mitochondrial substrate carrier family protein n=1 Tax=Striga asiatica TaxID=4170 RepID=A0A5A7Q7R3_STRAF|nr:mitochondrial substrate carrier family protein [Striga asiatica]
MGEEKTKSTGVWPTVKPFVNGGASGMLATCVIQPIDMIKVRIQLGQGSAADVTRNMLKNEGLGAFYKGLSAGLLRQATYTTARLGSFNLASFSASLTKISLCCVIEILNHFNTFILMLTNKAIEANDGKPLPLYQKALCGLTAGAIGACVGSPADLALIRMQADATLPAAQRRNYTNAFHALSRIIADEGVLALWKGAGPTVVRAMALNMGMLASYDQSVEFFKDSLGFGEATTVVGASTVSGFFAAACSLPFDYVKTQIQKMQPDAAGKYPYTGSLDCAMKTLKAGGPFKFYTGFPVYCVRIAPHVMMTWIFLNQIQKFEKSIGL